MIYTLKITVIVLWLLFTTILCISFLGIIAIAMINKEEEWFQFPKTILDDK